MVVITKEIWEKNGVEVVIFNGEKWLNEKNIEKQLDRSTLRKTFSKYSPNLENKDKKYKITVTNSLVEYF